MLKGIWHGFGAMFGGVWESIAPYQGIFWFFLLALVLLAAVLAVGAYYLLWKDLDHDD